MSKICVTCEKEILSRTRRGKECNNCTSNRRRREAKLKALELLGGKCIKCGYNAHPAALEFHHLDKEEKDFSFSRFHNRKWKTLEQELRKCVILCSNCHRIEHSKIYTQMPSSYRG